MDEKRKNKQLVFLDNSRISAYKACPMRYMIRHKLGWTTIGTKPALGFGGAWHKGMESILTSFKILRDSGGTPGSNFKTSVLERAKIEFMNEWHLREMPDPNDLTNAEKLFPRVPGVAFELMGYFLDVKYDWLMDVKVLEIERPFIVPLFETDDHRVFLIGRRDAVIQDSDGIWAVEHKTTSLKAAKDKCVNGNFFQYKFLNKWGMDAQISSYTYSLKMDYGKAAKGVYVIGYLVHKDIMSILPSYGSENMFKTIPQFKSDEMLGDWFNSTVYWVKSLLESRQTNFYPRNESSCEHQYGSCEFKPICSMIAEPEKLATIPMDYKEEFWQPFNESQLESIINGIEK